VSIGEWTVKAVVKHNAACWQEQSARRSEPKWNGEGKQGEGRRAIESNELQDAGMEGPGENPKAKRTQSDAAEPSELSNQHASAPT